MLKGRLFALTALLVAGAALLAGLLALGTPAHEREVKWDHLRAERLGGLNEALANYYVLHHKLPGRLSVLQSKVEKLDDYKDPQTQRPFQYQIINSVQYRLCAEFGTDTRHDRFAQGEPLFFTHPAGRYCFPISMH